jgi:hypothetical protein
MKKSKILASIPKNLVIYHTKKLCHHIEHILLYFWLKYGIIWTNIVNFIESFSIKLCSGTCSWAIFKDSQGHILIIQIIKNHHHFNQELFS